MCSDTETLQQIEVIGEYMHEVHSRLEVERGQGSHELIIYEPNAITQGKDVYYDYLGIAGSLRKKFGCIKVEEKIGKVIVTI